GRVDFPADDNADVSPWRGGIYVGGGDVRSGAHRCLWQLDSLASRLVAWAPGIRIARPLVSRSIAVSFALTHLDSVPIDRYRGVTYRSEPFSSIAGEGAQLFHKHYLEASANLNEPLNVNWDMFRKLEKAGLEVCVTARHTGRLIGYAVYILIPHMHYKHL